MNAVKHFLANPAEIKKAATAFVACAVLAVGAHLLPETVGNWVKALEPLLVAYGVWQVPNTPKN